VNALDVVILGVAAAAAVGGYRLGLVARASSWLGMLVGIALAARAVGPVAGAIEGASDARIVLTAAGLLLGGAFLGQALGLVVGGRIHYALPRGWPRDADRSAGAVMGAIGVAVAVWLLTPAMAQVPGDTARLARNSSIAGALADLLPPAPDALRELERLVGADLPDVLADLEPAPDLGAPPPTSGLSPEVQEQVAASTVQVEVRACGRVQEGSGAVLAPELVVTNAHVVAGAEELEVVRHPDGARLRGRLVAFDHRRDVAVLAVPGIDRPPLPLGDAGVGDVGAVFGHPGGGPLEVSPFLVGREGTATGRDIYGRERIERQILFLAAELRPGDSGGALVDPAGAAVGLAFAIAPDRPNQAYALTIEEVEAVLASGLGPTEPGPCLR
jgi:S1-C subfamily serine protease